MAKLVMLFEKLDLLWDKSERMFRKFEIRV